MIIYRHKQVKVKWTRTWRMKWKLDLYRLYMVITLENAWVRPGALKIVEHQIDHQGEHGIETGHLDSSSPCIRLCAVGNSQEVLRLQTLNLFRKKSLSPKLRGHDEAPICFPAQPDTRHVFSPTFGVQSPQFCGASGLGFRVLCPYPTGDYERTTVGY